MVTEKRQPHRSDLAIHPGEVLAEELEARAMTQRSLARAIERPDQVINEIVRGRKGITAETALQLSDALGISAEFWMNLQTNYALTLARQASGGGRGRRASAAGRRVDHSKAGRRRTIAR